MARRFGYPRRVRHPPPTLDSRRWLTFPFRAGDIVISTPPRSGTTWTQMICALLIFQTADLPGPLWRLSPWLDAPDGPGDAEVGADLAAQRHRRFIKTHTPLAAIPDDPRVTYIVTARHPLDAFVSMYHQHQAMGPPPPSHHGPPPPRPPAPSPERLHRAVLGWIADDGSRPDPAALNATMRHLSDAWRRRADPNVVLVHYDDLRADLDGEMRRIAGRLGIAVPEETWPALVEAATFARMRARDDAVPPPPPGRPPPPTFFRRGTSGAGREILSDEELARYHARVAALGPSDLIAWLHR